MVVFYNKLKVNKFIQSYKKQYIILKSTEESNKYIVSCTITKFLNKEKYMKMKKQYQQWYRYESRLLKAIENLNLMYYKLAKPHFKSMENIQREVDAFFDDNEIDDIDVFLES